MAVKAINDTAGAYVLVPKLLVFGVHPQMRDLDLPAPRISQRAKAINKPMDEVRKTKGERQVNDVLNTRNGLTVLPLKNDPWTIYP